MSDVLVRIKRAVLAGRYAFSEKARIEMEMDGLTESDVAESSAPGVSCAPVGSNTSASFNPRRLTA